MKQREYKPNIMSTYFPKKKYKKKRLRAAAQKALQ